MLVGDIYLLTNGIWTLEFFALYKDKNTPILIQYFSKENKNVKKQIVLDTWNIKKEDRLKILNDIQIYPFSIIILQQKIVLGFTTRKERTVWKNYLYSTKHFKFPLDINILVEPCIICDTAWEIVSVNTSMTDFLGKLCKIGDNMNVFIHDYFTQFCKYCTTILREDCVLYSHRTFSLLLKGPENTKYTVNCRISLLKYKENPYFLCQIFSIHNDNIDNDNINSLEKKYQEPLRMLISNIAEMSLENHKLKSEKHTSNLSLNTKISLNSVESTPRDSNSSPLLTPVKKNKRSIPMLNTRGKSLSTLRFAQSEIKNSILSTRRHLNTENNKEPVTLNRTDGFTARTGIRNMITMKKFYTDMAYRQISKEWENIHPRVAVIGGGNSLLLGWQLTCFGAEVTIIEHQEERAIIMNDRDWHMLDEIRSSPCAIAFASLMMDLMNNELGGRIYATILPSQAILFSDLLILEIPPLPFDNLLHLQIEQIKLFFQPGQILLLECDPSIPVAQLNDVMLEISKLLPDIKSICITSCSNIFNLETKFKLQVGLQITDLDMMKSFSTNISTLIKKSIKDFIMECNASRLKNLIVFDNDNYNILHSIIKWIIEDYGTRNLLFFE